MNNNVENIVENVWSLFQGDVLWSQTQPRKKLEFSATLKLLQEMKRKMDKTKIINLEHHK